MEIARRTDLEPMPWHKAEGESSLQFEAFSIYLELGYKRNLTIANEIFVKKRKEFVESLGYDPESNEDTSGNIQDKPSDADKLRRIAKKIKDGKYKGFPARWPKDFNWKERADAYDRHMNAVRQRAVERNARRNEKKRQVLRQKADEHAIVAAETLIYRSLQFFKDVKNIDLSTSDALAMLRLAMEIKDRVLGPPEATLKTPIDYVKNPIGSGASGSGDSGPRPIAMVEVRVPKRDIEEEIREVIDVTPQD
jgi:hypothetical protein